MADNWQEIPYTPFLIPCQIFNWNIHSFIYFLLRAFPLLKMLSRYSHYYWMKFNAEIFSS